jgi:FkbM family methyltransferase
MEHHSIFKKFKPYQGKCSTDYVVNFLGVFVKKNYIRNFNPKPPSIPQENFIQTDYPEFNHSYFEMISLLEAVVNAKYKFTMIELGAGIGHQVIQAAAAIHTYHGSEFPFKLIAVEGEPTAFKWMKNHFEKNNVDPTAHLLIEAVVSDKDGSVLFEIGYPEGFGSYVVSPFRYFTNPLRWIRRFLKRIYKQLKGQELVATDYWTGSKGLGIYTKKIKSVSLNSLLLDLEIIDYLHIDIFKQELQVLKSAMKQLTEKVRVIHIETHTTKAEEELHKIFNSGWKCINNYPIGGIRKTLYGSFNFIDGVQTWKNISLDVSVR